MQRRNVSKTFSRAVTEFPEGVNKFTRLVGPTRKLRLWYSQVLADLDYEFIVDLGMSRDRRTTILFWVDPPRMTAAFAKKDASVLLEITDQITPLHAAMGASSKVGPAI